MSKLDVVLISVRSPHVEHILDGSKTVELRRRAVRIRPGSVVLLYAAGVRKELVGAFTSGPVTCDSPAMLWRRYQEMAGLSRKDFDSYFEGVAAGYVLPVRNLRPLRVPIPLAELRRRWPQFTAPQTHRTVNRLELGRVLNGEHSELMGRVETTRGLVGSEG